MLLEFSVENFMSFKERAILRLESSKDKEHPENVVKKGDYRGANIMTIYGANASGKTNFFKAITLALLMIRSSNTRQVNDILPIVPFKFSEENIQKPSKFEFQFIAADQKKYVYGFSADFHIIHEEYLYRYSSRKPTKIFERHSDGTYEFTSREFNLLNPLTQMNTPNKFFIATATMWNAQSTKIPLEWLTSGVDTYTELGAVTTEMLNKYQGNESEEYVQFAEKLVSEMDINISKIDVKAERIKVNPGLGPLMINGQLVQQQEQINLKVNTYHDIRSEDGETTSRYMLSMAEESKGTQTLFNFAPVLKRALEEGRTIIIDEIDHSLHPTVVKRIINFFRDKEINKEGAQLVVTTHDTSLLRLEMLRRDQIDFVEKDQCTGISAIKSMAEFSVRKDENIEKGYLNGRYGAIPDIKGGDII